MPPQEWDLNRRVVVRKLPGNATKEEIFALFSSFGTINYIFIAHKPPGFAFLEYKHRRDAKRAVSEGNGKRCCGSYVRVELTIRDLDCTVVIRNISKSLTKEDIRNVFDKCGRIQRVWLERFQQVFAFVEYVHSSDAKAAVRVLDGKRCWGCVIHVASPRHPNARSMHSRYQLRQSRNLTIESSSNESNEVSRSSRNEPRSGQQLSREARAVSELTVESSTSQCLECRICMNNALKNSPTSTTCGHIFCEACIKTALLRFERCPFCQQNLSLNDLIRMYP